MFPNSELEREREREQKERKQERLEREEEAFLGGTDTDYIGVQPWFGMPSCIPVYLLKTVKGRSVLFLFLYQRIIQFIKVFRVFRNITSIRTFKPKHGRRPSYKGLKIFCLCLQGLQEHEYQIEHIWTQQKFLFSSKYFSQAIVPEEYGPQETKRKEKY